MQKFHIGGITPFTSIDFPEKLSCVFYFQGCVFRCPYCHNAEFQEKKEAKYSFSEVADFLKERVGLLDAVVFSGGEPLLFVNELSELASFAKKKGFLVGLHTTGYSPEKLRKLIDEKLVDWVGIDLKSHKDFYPEASGVKKNFFPETIESIKLLKEQNVDFEVRTTVYKDIADKNSIENILSVYEKLGVNPVFQVYSENGKRDTEILAFLNNFLKQSPSSFKIR